jgi:O-antigen/teichoic acid export membrane protein
MPQSDQENKIPLHSQLPADPLGSSEEVPNLKTSSLTTKTFQGLKWSYLDTGVNAVLQIGYTAVMARLLSPADFGLVAMANVVLRFGSYFAQMGMGSALVQKDDLSEQEIRAGFTSSVVLSILMFSLFWFAAPLSTYIFDNLFLVSIVRLLAISFILTGFSTTAISLLRRNLAFRSIAIIDITSFVLGYGGGGIILAFNGFGVYSLVVAALSQSLIMVIMAYIFTRHSIALIFEWKYFKNLYKFGGRVSIIGFMEFIGLNLDSMAIGRFLGDAALGVYNRAYMLVNLPMHYLIISFSRVLMPAYSRVQGDLIKLKKVYLSSILLVASVMIPLCWGLSFSSKEIVILVLGDKWLNSIQVLSILAFAIPTRFLTYLGTIILESTAKLKSKLIIQFLYIFVLGLLYFIFHAFDIIGYAVGLLIGEIFLFFLYLKVMKNYLSISWLDLYYSYKPGIVSGFIICIIFILLNLYFSQTEFSILIILIIKLIFGGMSLLLIYRFFNSHELLRLEVRDQFRKTGFKLVGNTRTNIFKFIFGKGYF